MDKTPVIVGVITGFGILGIYVAQAFADVPNPMFESNIVGLLWGGAGLGAIVLGFVIFNWLSGKASAELSHVSQQLQKLATEAEPLKALVSDPALKKIPNHILQRTPEELKSMQVEREKLMAEWLEAPV